MNEDYIQTDIERVKGDSKNLTLSIQNVKHEFKIKWLEADVVIEGIRKITDHHDRMLCSFLWMTGVRVSELCLIKKEDIDLKEGFMVIKWQKNRLFEKRVVPIHPTLQGILSMYTAVMNQKDRVFPITRQRAFQITQQWLGVSPHKLRHSFAVNFVKQNDSAWGLRILQKLLGHSNISSTLVYLDVVPVDQAKELSKIEVWK